jgi:RecB family endonuclease NucS
MDVLLVDEVGTPVVVECKQDAPTLGHLQQLRAYMAQVRKDIGKVPRGILVHGGARKLRSEVRIAAQLKPRIDLAQHNLDVVFSRST